MDQKPTMWHHRLIVKKYKLLNFDSFIKWNTGWNKTKHVAAESVVLCE